MGANLIVTAFGQFPGVDANPTECLVKRLQEAIDSEAGPDLPGVCVARLC